MNVLMVLTSHSQLGDTGKKTGFWLEEFAAPYYVFKDAGATLTLASPAGGQPPLDPKSDAADAQTDATRRFKSDDTASSSAAKPTAPGNRRSPTRCACPRCRAMTSTRCSIPAGMARCGIWPRTPTRSS